MYNGNIGPILGYFLLCKRYTREARKSLFAKMRDRFCLKRINHEQIIDLFLAEVDNSFHSADYFNQWLYMQFEKGRFYFKYHEIYLDTDIK